MSSAPAASVRRHAASDAECRLLVEDGRLYVLPQRHLHRHAPLTHREGEGEGRGVSGDDMEERGGGGGEASEGARGR